MLSIGQVFERARQVWNLNHSSHSEARNNRKNCQRLSNEPPTQQERRPAPPDANAPEARSVYTHLDQIFVAMTEAIFRLITSYPGLVDKVAHTFPLEPGQPRRQHFDRMMEAVSTAARNYPGLGRAIGDTLDPFSKDPIWEQCSS